jgi:hypothetical protein
MPQLQNLVLTDRESTPVDHTFVPRDIRDGVGEVVESSGVPVGENRYTISLRKTPNSRYKSTIKMVIPVVQNQVESGITTPVVVRTAYATVEFDFDSKSTTQERNNVVGMLASSLGASKVLVNDTVVNLQGVY